MWELKDWLILPCQSFPLFLCFYFNQVWSFWFSRRGIDKKKQHWFVLFCFKSLLLFELTSTFLPWVIREGSLSLDSGVPKGVQARYTNVCQSQICQFLLHFDFCTEVYLLWQYQDNETTRAKFHLQSSLLTEDKPQRPPSIGTKSQASPSDQTQALFPAW